MKTVQLKQKGHFVLDEEKGQSGENGSTLTTQYIKKGICGPFSDLSETQWADQLLLTDHYPGQQR